MPANVELMESIHRIGRDIHETRQKVRTVKSGYRDAVEQLDEYRDLRDALATAAEARGKLKAAVKEDRTCSALAEDLDELSFKLKDQREILSIHLVKYRQDTGEKEVKFEEEEGKVRPIIITAKLGKPEYHQEEMFKEGS